MFGISQATLVALGLAAVNLIVLLALYRTFAPNDAINARAAAHAKRRMELRQNLLVTKRAERRGQSVAAVRGVLENLKLLRSEEGRKATDSLAKAGYRGGDALTIFLGIRLAAPVVLGILAFVASARLQPLYHLIAPFVGVVVGAYGPTVVLQNLVERRKEKVQRSLPDALDLFVICADAGLSMDAAMARVSREMAPSAPELSDELGLTSVELGFLPVRMDALANLGRRVDTPSIRGLITTLVQTEKYGTPLVQALRVLSAEFRNMRMMKAEEKAAQLPATLTVPMILFILPPLFVVLIGPAAIHVMHIMNHQPA